jgi:hypothetical protein
MSWNNVNKENKTSMKPVERAAKLKQEAGEVLKLVGLAERIEPWGRITPTGSYLLDVMAFPDLDLYVPPIPMKELIDIGAAVAEIDIVQKVAFEKSNAPTLPGAAYLMLSIDYGNWGRPWMVHMWSLDEDMLNARMEIYQDFRAKITPVLREKILEYKHAVMTLDERTPRFIGYYIYQAFLEEGLVEFPDVTSYLNEHGIKIY